MRNLHVAMVYDGTNSKFRAYPRQLAVHMSIEAASKKSGIATGTFPSENWSGTDATTYIQALNDALKPLFITVYRA